MNFYYHTTEVVGPVSIAELNALYDSGKINNDTQVCEEGANTWQSYGSVFADPENPAPKQISAWERMESQAAHRNATAARKARAKLIPKPTYVHVFEWLTVIQLIWFVFVLLGNLVGFFPVGGAVVVGALMGWAILKGITKLITPKNLKPEP